jgi:hypothetical protein
MQIIKGENPAYQSGIMFKEFIVQKIGQLREEIDFIKSNGRLYKVYEKVLKVFPDYICELKQKALGSGVDYMDLFALYCQELLELGSGCSTILYRRRNNEVLIAHNEDDNFVEGNSALTVVNNGSLKEANCDYFDSPFGNAFSWNSYGIVITINYVYTENPDILGIPRTFIPRFAMESVSLENAIERMNMIKEIISSGYSLNILDTKTNNACNIEISKGIVVVHYLEKQLVHTNHYLSPEMPDYKKVDEGSSSIFRSEKLNSLLNEKMDFELCSLQRNLSYRGANYDDSVIRTDEDSHITGYQFLLSTKDKRINILEYIGLDYKKHKSGNYIDRCNRIMEFDYNELF